MRIAMMADIHANREAFAACLAHAEKAGIDRYVFLGDFVGYGADPEWVVDTVAGMVDRGAVALLGNHDNAVADAKEQMNTNATLAIEWTRGRLNDRQRAFLAALRTSYDDGDLLFVHAEGSAPRRWHYMTDAEDALRSLKATAARLTFCGHVHMPTIFGLTATEKLTRFRPVTGVAVPLLRQRRWVAVVGSVGQPRDGDAAASYAVFDVAKSEITYHRVPYDVEAAARKIVVAGLPQALAARLFMGR